MHVQLDDERWEIADSTSLNDVLASISDAAHARGRLVMTLRVGDRMFTDRDLLPSVLVRPVGEVGAVVATSETMDAVIMNGSDHAKKFGGALRVEAESLATYFRRGEQRFRQLDDWLGRLADYIEWAELARTVAASESPASPAPWIPELLNARDAHDTVRLADVLEYEVVPRLPHAGNHERGKP